MLSERGDAANMEVIGEPTVVADQLVPMWKQSTPIYDGSAQRLSTEAVGAWGRATRVPEPADLIQDAEDIAGRAWLETRGGFSVDVRFSCNQTMHT